MEHFFFIVLEIGSITAIVERHDDEKDFITKEELQKLNINLENQPLKPTSQKLMIMKSIYICIIYGRYINVYLLSFRFPPCLYNWFRKIFTQRLSAGPSFFLNAHRHHTFGGEAFQNIQAGKKR